MLARSSSSSETELKNIVESTATIVFLGTPHRGSQGVAALGEVVRSLVSSFGMETTPVILDALGLKTTDLLRAQEDFSTLWQKYDFRVKTFQEAFGLTGINLGVLGNKVVPDSSSSIGDSRERAETIQANHREMCRFKGTEDPGYQKLAGEIRHTYVQLVNSHTLDAQVIEYIELPPEQQFKHVVYNLVHSSLKGSNTYDWTSYQYGTPLDMVRDTNDSDKSQDGAPEVIITDTGLRKVKPYWYNYTTMAKGRWLGREILEIISTEFRDRSMEYYVRPGLCLFRAF